MYIKENMTDATIDDYLAKVDNNIVPTVVVTKANKKRKTADTQAADNLKQKARLHCKCPEQWRSVSKYNPKRMTEFVQEQEFNQQQALYESLFSFAHRVFALVVDKVSLGNGFIQTEIENDLTLRQCIEEEGSRFVQFMNNRWKLAALTSVDVFNGKRTQMLTEPTPEAVIEEEKDEETNPNRKEFGGRQDNFVVPQEPRNDETDITTPEDSTTS